MQSITTVLELIGLFFVLIATVSVHELGHWLSARLFKVWTPVFSIGFGQKYLVLGRTTHTQFRLSLNPLGGYCKIHLGALSPEESAVDESLYGVKALPTRAVSNWQTAIILVAGVAMNLLFAMSVTAGALIAHGAGTQQALLETLFISATQAKEILELFTGLAADSAPHPIVTISFVKSIAYLNIFMAMWNLLPYPGSDGWRLLTVGAESVLGKQLTRSQENSLAVAVMALAMIVILAFLARSMFH